MHVNVRVCAGGRGGLARDEKGGRSRPPLGLEPRTLTMELGTTTNSTNNQFWH